MNIIWIFAGLLIGLGNGETVLLTRSSALNEDFYQILNPRSGAPPRRNSQGGGIAPANRVPNLGRVSEGATSIASTGVSTSTASSAPPRDVRMQTSVTGPASIKIWKGREVNLKGKPTEKIKVKSGQPFTKTWTDPHEIHGKFKTKGISGKHQTIMKGKETMSHFKPDWFFGGAAYHWKQDDGGQRHGGGNVPGYNPLGGVGQWKSKMEGKAVGRVVHKMGVTSETFFPGG